MPERNLAKLITEECDHLKEGSGYLYRVAVGIPVGPFRNIVICKNCWAVIKALAYEEVLIEAARTIQIKSTEGNNG